MPVVVMTASRHLDGIQASDVVFKPPSLDGLFSVIERHVASGEERAD